MEGDGTKRHLICLLLYINLLQCRNCAQRE